MFNIFSSSSKKAQASPLSPAAKPAAPAAHVAAQPQQDIRTAYLSEHELDAGNLTSLCDVAEGPALILGFLSPDLSMDRVAQTIKREIPGSAKLIMMTTAGELCRPANSASLYCPADEGRGKILLQAFSNRMIEDTYTMNIPLHNEDLRSKSVTMSVNDRVELIQQEISRHKVPFRISVNHTFALVYIDGVSGCETFLLQALFDAGKFPCPFIGGSSAGNLDFAHTYIFNGDRTLENHAVVTFVRLKKEYRYGILKTQAVER
ncbi:MAG: histidine kinase, partial [Selenomonadaceae bacterium]|nr:histidine kinase [Selenomonadaceae bacterium]